MVEHVQTLIQSLAERVIVLDWGRKIAEGTPAEVSRDPNVRSVYLGSQSELDGEAGPRHSPTETHETVLRAEGITVDYGKLRALRAVDLEVRRGEIVAVLGANGAGKSTLARALAGLAPLSAGRVYLAGVDVTRRPAFVRARSGIEGRV